MSSKKKKKSTATKGKPSKSNGQKPEKSKKKKKRKRVKVETDSKSKQQRRKILEVRSMQTRFASTAAENGNNDNSHKPANNEPEAALIQLSESQEDAISALEYAFIEYDEDYYGFIEYDKFLSILKENKIQLSHKQETYLIIALTLIEDGVDYNGFLRILTTKAHVYPDSNLTKICQQIAVESEQQSLNESKQKEEAKNAPIEVDEDEMNRFYGAAQNAEARGMSLAQMEHTSMVIPSSNKIRQVIEEFALDGVEVDFAIFKTALAEIDCNPNDEDLIFLINYLAHKDDEKEVDIESSMDDDDLFVDFNYFISFCQEVINIPVILWVNPERVIEKVAKQTRMAYRTQQRRKIDRVKIKERLANRKKNKHEKSKRNDELKQIEADEKRLRALKLREKAKMVSAPKRGEEKMKLKEWISKRGKKQSKKAQHELKKWMQTNNVFQKHLYNELCQNGVISLDALKKTGSVKMDHILRKVRNDRFAEVKNTQSRNKMDKLLVNFEKQWKKTKKVKKNTAKKKKSSKRKK